MADTEAAAPTNLEEVTETPVEEVAAEEEVAADGEEAPADAAVEEAAPADDATEEAAVTE